MANYPDPTPLEKRHKLAKAVHKIALALPDAWEDHPWGDIVYKVGPKIFLFVGGKTGGIGVKARPEDAAGLREVPGITAMAYIGRHGWISVEPDLVKDLAFAEGLIHASYELVAPKKKRVAKK